NPLARVILRKRADAGSVTLRKGAETWTLPGGHDGPRAEILEVARRAGYEVGEGEGVVAAAPTQEIPKMKRREIVAIAKSFAEEGGEVTLEKRDFYSAMLKGAEKIRQPGQSAEQAFAAYIASA